MEQKRTVRKGDVANIHPRWRLFAVAALVFAAAFIMGLPTLRGSFVGGDDHRLVLNHVLVNHPSPAHAIELFGMVHRDLYQPLPLLSFSLEFAFANTVGLFDRGLSGGAWLFHLTNIILHALNAVLVWRVIIVMQQPRWTENPFSVPPQVPRNTAHAGQQSVFGNHAVATIAAINGHAVARETRSLPAIRFDEMFSYVEPLSRADDEKPPLVGKLCYAHLSSPVGLGFKFAFEDGECTVVFTGDTLHDRSFLPIFKTTPPTSNLCTICSDMTFMTTG